MIRFQKINPEAILPRRKNEFAAGFDFYADESVVIPEGQSYTIKTGIQVRVPEGWVGVFHSRFKMAFKNKAIILGGVVNSDYRDEVHIGIHNAGLDPIEIRKGDAIAQLVVSPFMAAWREI